MHRHDQRSTAHADDRNVADEVEAQIFVERGVDGCGRIGSQQSITVGGRAYDRLGRQVACGSGSVLDDKRLAKSRRQQLPYQSHENIGPAAGRLSDNAVHRT